MVELPVDADQLRHVKAVPAGGGVVRVQVDGRIGLRIQQKHVAERGGDLLVSAPHVVAKLDRVVEAAVAVEVDDRHATLRPPQRNLSLAIGCRIE